MGRYKLWIWLAAIALAIVGVGARMVLTAQAEESAARAVAVSYVDLIAEGGEDDLRRLAALTVTEAQGALRTAGDALVAAEERIEVVEVGAPRPTGGAEAPYEVELDEFVAIDVRFRLAGAEHEVPIVLGRLLDEDGTDVADWRVVTPLVGVIDWQQAAFADLEADAYVSSIRQVRRALLFGGDEDAQPLYPAVYTTQRRLDPYYASEEAPLTITGREPVAPPELRLGPTKTTRDLLRRQFLGLFRHCATRRFDFRCPVRDLAFPSSYGLEEGWWIGLTKRPTVTVDREGITITGGEFRFRRDGVERRMRFGGTASSFISIDTWRPVVSLPELEETP